MLSRLYKKDDSETGNRNVNEEVDKGHQYKSTLRSKVATVATPLATL